MGNLYRTPFREKEWTEPSELICEVKSLSSARELLGEPDTAFDGMLIYGDAAYTMYPARIDDCVKSDVALLPQSTEGNEQ